jgi:hypothetical protein
VLECEKCSNVVVESNLEAQVGEVLLLQKGYFSLGLKVRLNDAGTPCYLFSAARVAKIPSLDN